ncbi:DUF6053 domain-containing protein [Lysobacter gummosus]|uniref:DUF6053 domain-containing protein n=1 Tax=Lysobacter gummosus TaxID=262324 RepID=UPI001C9DFE80
MEAFCGRGFSPDALRSDLFESRKPSAAAIGAQSIGAEAPPTKAFDACAMPDSQAIRPFRSWRPGHA